MTDLRDLIPTPVEGRTTWYGLISKSAPSMLAEVPVIIPEFDRQLEWGPCRWQPRDDFSLPQAGDQCMVSFDNRRQPWITSWWPATIAVQNGKWQKGAGGAVIWADIQPADIIGLSGSGLHANRPAASAVNVGSIYKSTDRGGTWQSTGTTWILIAQIPWYATTGQFPALPYAGEMILHVDALANPQYEWLVYYNAGSTSPYKWECIGGVPNFGYSSANQVVNVLNTWQNIGTAAISTTRPGEYIWTANAQTSHPSAGATNYICLWSGSVPGGLFGTIKTTGFPVAGGYSASLSVGPFRAANGGGLSIGVAAQTNVAGASFSFVEWSLIPARLS